jgi:hypothetical protein
MKVKSTPDQTRSYWIDLVEIEIGKNLAGIGAFFGNEWT